MRVVVGMSGGVDSAVSALLLKEQGHEVIGLFMYNWEETGDDGACTAETDFLDVKKVCGVLGIPYYSVNFAEEYLERVFSYFLAEYSAGRTPNPDVLCNREIKFGPFLNYALNMGADKIATGHYAGLDIIDDSYYLKKAADENKDQTYFLHQLSQHQLSKTIFPLADYKKDQTREIAEKYNLPVSKKKDSTGICFIGERKFKQFLQNYLPAKSGDIVDLNNNIVGKHDGLMYYTLGQRRGLGIGGGFGGDGRWYVVDKDLKNNRLIVSCGEGEELFSNALIAKEVNWIKKPDKISFECFAKFRYRQAEQRVCVTIQNDGVEVKFETPQRAVTPGQYAVFYDDKYCLGGGVIDKVIK